MNSQAHENSYFDKFNEFKPINSFLKDTSCEGVAVIIVSVNRSDLVCRQLEESNVWFDKYKPDVYVVEMGEEVGDYSSLKTNLNIDVIHAFEKNGFRGKCYGHNVGLRHALLKKNYKYVWSLMNDVLFSEYEQPPIIDYMVDFLERNQDVAFISPTEPDSTSHHGKTKPNSEYRFVHNCDYLALFMSTNTIKNIGYLNPSFLYSWGASPELSYLGYKKGKKTAYIDKLKMRHLGGSTYGKVKGVPSRKSYQAEAAKFCSLYFRENYGVNWDREFDSVLSSDCENKKPFEKARKFWDSHLVYGPTKSLSFKERIKRYFWDKNKRELVSRIESLSPWYYPVKIKGLPVIPGQGSIQGTDSLNGRIEYRTRILVDEFLKHYNVRGKSILDIASNISYWASKYCEQGASSVLGVEGRVDYIQQANLYWSNNSFVEQGKFSFMKGNVCSSKTWDKINRQKPFDLVICCGILYHIPDYKQLLNEIEGVTKDAVLIDTRVEAEERFVQEPGGYSFDAIRDTSYKTVPTEDNLTKHMRELGFKAIKLETSGEVPVGLKGADDYSLNNRVCYLFLRK